MGRIRTIKPEFPQSESVGRLSRDARLLFLQLFTIVDDSGRAKATLPVLAGQLYPFDGEVPIEGWLREIEGEGMIVRYQVDERSYLQICKWNQHQVINRPSKSRIPGPPESLNNPESSLKDHGTINAGPRIMDLGTGTVEGDPLRAEVGAESAPEPAAAGTLDGPTGIAADDFGASSRVDDSYREERAARTPLVVNSAGGPTGNQPMGELVAQILATYPKVAAGHQLKGTVLVKAEQIGPTVEDGLRYLLDRTRLYADEVASWPPASRRLAYAPEKFFAQELYAQEPEYWTVGRSSTPELLPRARITPR